MAVGVIYQYLLALPLFLATEVWIFGRQFNAVIKFLKRSLTQRLHKVISTTIETSALFINILNVILIRTQ